VVASQKIHSKSHVIIPFPFLLPLHYDFRRNRENGTQATLCRFTS
jgi:hypothetical protein